MNYKFGLICCAITAISTTGMAQTPAFPGAEGHGRYTTGGRGGKIIHVTNLNDSGEGSLREAVKGSDKKIVVFDVGGIIALESDLKIGANTTILGQTAPGQGVTLRYYTTGYDGDNIIVRFMRFRRGQEVDVNDGADATWTRHHKNIMIDHCSMSWSIDEVASFYDNRDFTMQWCTIAESLNDAGHGKGDHGYGGIWGGKNASFHHNLIAHCNNRTPRFNGARYAWDGYDQTLYENTVLAERVDFRNCVIYNWGTGGCYGGPGGGFVNMVNNYYKAGPATKTKNRVTQCTLSASGNSDSHTELYGLMSRYYIKGNYVYGYGAYYDWNGVVTDTKEFTFTDANGFYGEGENATINVKMEQPIDAGTVTTHKAETAFDNVRTYAGASLARDAQDTRYADEALNGTATYTGSRQGMKGIIDLVADQGEYTLEESSRPSDFDTDGDGIPDAWETANGLNPNNADDANLYTIDTQKKYTNIEVYANSQVQDIMLAENANAETAVDEYYPAYTKTDGTFVEAINKASDTPDTPGDNGKTDVATGAITWPLTSGSIESGICSSSIADDIASATMTVGDNLSLTTTRTVNDVTMTEMESAEKQTAASTANAVSFTITPSDGMFFKPTKVSFNISRIGTDSGVFDLVWQNADGTTTLASSNDINRNRESNGWYTTYSCDIADITPATGESALHLYIYNVNADKSTAVGNVVIEGTVSKSVETGIREVTAQTAASAPLYNLQGQRVAKGTKGLLIHNGKKFLSK